MASTYLIGDIHGEYRKLLTILRKSKLITERFQWSGKDAVLWFLGDFFDRGEDSIACVDLVMQLQQQAADTGGQVRCLLGNHDILMMAVDRFRHKPSLFGYQLEQVWLANGGRYADLDSFEDKHREWLVNLPFIAQYKDRLLIHADAYFLYSSHGQTVEQVNNSLGAIIQHDAASDWDMLMSDFSERLAFLSGSNIIVDADETIDTKSGLAKARHMLKMFTGRQIIHGHTPICKVTPLLPHQVINPLIYANDLCINIDGGMYMGGPGFVYKLPPLDSPSSEK